MNFLAQALTKVQWQTRWPDLLVGIALAGIVLPEAIAYAGLANMPPLAGIVAACVGLLIYSAIGLSRFAVVAGTSSSAIVLVAATHSLSSTGTSSEHITASGSTFASALVIVTGLFFLISAVFKLGRIAHFISRPVVRGTALGLAITIVLRQFAKIANLDTTHTDVFPLLIELCQRVNEWQWTSVTLGTGTLVLLNLCKPWPRIPAPLLAMLAGICISFNIDLHAHQIKTVSDALIGDIGNWQLKVPILDGDEWLRVAELAMALMLILFSESYGSIRNSALQSNESVNVNRELLALGVANLISGMLHALPVGAGYSATTANQMIGARSRLAGFAAAIYILITLYFLLGFVGLIPEPVLAAIVIYAMQHALSIEPLRPYLRWRRDRLVVLITVIAVLAFGVLDGLLASVAFSLILLIRGLAQPRISILGRLRDTHDYVPMASPADVHLLPDVLIVRPDEPLFFANVDDILEKTEHALNEMPHIKILIMSLEESPNVDGTVIEALDLFSKHLHNKGYRLALARLKPSVHAVLQRAQLQYLNESALNTISVAAVVDAVTYEYKAV